MHLGPASAASDLGQVPHPPRRRLLCLRRLPALKLSLPSARVISGLTSRARDLFYLAIFPQHTSFLQTITPRLQKVTPASLYLHKCFSISKVL